MELSTVALLGLGTMGSGMATNLLKAGYPLAVWNRSMEKAEPLVAMGARRAATPAEAAQDASFIVSMLADDDASRSAWLGEAGAVAGARAGCILIECSTVSPRFIGELAGAAAARGLEVLDAPVTGSRGQAAAGQLNFLVGGSESALGLATPILQAMGKEIIALGASGSGSKMKLINNFLCGVQVASLAESLAWIERSGLDREKALTVLKNGAPGSPLLAAISARMVNQDYAVNFLLKLMEKDLRYAHAAAADLGIDLTTAANAACLFEKAITIGYAEKDMSAVVELPRGQQLPGTVPWSESKNDRAVT